MLEQEWMMSDDPVKLLRWLMTPFAERSLTHPEYVLSPQKLNLFTEAVNAICEQCAYGNPVSCEQSAIFAAGASGHLRQSVEANSVGRHNS